MMNKQSTTRRRNHISGAGVLKPLLLTAISCLVTSVAYGQFNMSLMPQVVAAEMKPGQRGVLPFTLVNFDKDKAITVRVVTRDIRQGMRGQYLLSDTSMPHSCVPWLTLADTILQIGPGETVKIPVKIKVPYTARGGAYGAVVFEMLPAEARPDAERPDVFGAQYRFQLPGWIEITVKRGGRVRSRLLPGKIEIVPTADDPGLAKEYGERGMLVMAEVENTGDIHVVTKGRLIIRDENGLLVRDTRLGGGRGVILPGAKTILRTIMKLPRPGKYLAKAIVQYGGRSPAIAQSTFEISSRRRARVGKSEIALPLFVDMRPERFEPSIPAEGFRVFGVTLLNREDAPVEVDVGLGQIRHDENGQMWVSEEDIARGRSCAPWLTVDPRHFVLEPQRRKNIRITLNVPEGVGGGYYSSVVLNARLVADTGASSLPSPIYCPIYLSVPPSLEYGGEVARVDIHRPTESSVTMTAEFHNTGNVHEVISGSVDVQRWIEPEVVAGVVVMDTARFENVVTIMLETDSIYILPGETRAVSCQTVEGLPEGRYRAQVTVNYGGQTPALLQREFVIKKPEESDATYELR